MLSTLESSLQVAQNTQEGPVKTSQLPTQLLHYSASGLLSFLNSRFLRSSPFANHLAVPIPSHSSHQQYHKKKNIT